MLFMLNISYAGCPGLSSGISSQFTLELCAAAKNCEKFSKNPSFEGSRSAMQLDLVGLPGIVDGNSPSLASACRNCLNE